MRFVTFVLLLLLMGASSTYAQNLVFNGDAEAGPGGNGMTIVQPPGWVLTGDFTTVFWSNGPGWMTPSAPGPVNRGSNYFAGGLTAMSIAVQTIDVSGQAAIIDAGGLQFVLTGYLGGWDTQDDHAQVVVVFEDAQGVSMGVDGIGPVLAAHRNNITGMLYRHKAGTVPAMTRKIEIRIVLTRTDQTYNDGYADNIEFETVVSSGLILTGPSSVVAGQSGDLIAHGGTPLGALHIGYSTTGAGPTVSQWGVLALTPPITISGVTIPLDSTGSGAITMPVPAGTTGITIWLQAGDQASGQLSNGLMILIT